MGENVLNAIRYLMNHSNYVVEYEDEDNESITLGRTPEEFASFMDVMKRQMNDDKPITLKMSFKYIQPVISTISEEGMKQYEKIYGSKKDDITDGRIAGETINGVRTDSDNAAGRAEALNFEEKDERWSAMLSPEIYQRHFKELIDYRYRFHYTEPQINMTGIKTVHPYGDLIPMEKFQRFLDYKMQGNLKQQVKTKLFERDIGLEWNGEMKTIPSIDAMTRLPGNLNVKSIRTSNVLALLRDGHSLVWPTNGGSDFLLIKFDEKEPRAEDKVAILMDEYVPYPNIYKMCSLTVPVFLKGDGLFCRTIKIENALINFEKSMVETGRAPAVPYGYESMVVNLREQAEQKVRQPGLKHINLEHIVKIIEQKGLARGTNIILVETGRAPAVPYGRESLEEDILEQARQKERIWNEIVDVPLDVDSMNWWPIDEFENRACTSSDQDLESFDRNMKSKFLKMYEDEQALKTEQRRLSENRKRTEMEEQLKKLETKIMNNVTELIQSSVKEALKQSDSAVNSVVINTSPKDLADDATGKINRELKGIRMTIEMNQKHGINPENMKITRSKIVRLKKAGSSVPVSIPVVEDSTLTAPTIRLSKPKKVLPEVETNIKKQANSYKIVKGDGFIQLTPVTKRFSGTKTATQTTVDGMTIENQTIEPDKYQIPLACGMSVSCQVNFRMQMRPRTRSELWLVLHYDHYYDKRILKPFLVMTNRVEELNPVLEHNRFFSSAGNSYHSLTLTSGNTCGRYEFEFQAYYMKRFIGERFKLAIIVNDEDEPESEGVMSNDEGIEEMEGDQEFYNANEESAKSCGVANRNETNVDQSEAGGVEQEKLVEKNEEIVESQVDGINNKPVGASSSSSSDENPSCDKSQKSDQLSTSEKKISRKLFKFAEKIEEWCARLSPEQRQTLADYGLDNIKSMIEKADNNVNGGGDNCLIELTKKYREQSKNNEKMETLLDEYNRANIEAIKEIGEIIPVNNAEKNNKAAINIGTIDSRTTIRSEDIKTLGAVYPNTKADNNVNGGGDNCLIELTKKYREQSKNNEKMETLLDEYNRANIEAIKEIGEIIPVNNAEKNNKAAINIGTIDSRTTIRSEDIKTLGAVYPNTKADNNVNGGGDNCLIELTKKYREQSKNNEKMETLLDEYNRANIEAIKEIGEIIPVNNAEKNNKAAINIGTIDSRTTIRSEDIKTLGAVYPNTKADNNVNGGGDNCLIELTKKYREQSKNNEKMETLLDEYNRANIEAIKEIGEIIPVNNAEKNNKAAINIGTIDSRTTIRSEDIKTLGAVYPNTKADNNVNGGGDNCLIELTKKYREQSKNNEKMETLLDEYNRANIEAIKEIGEIIPVNNAEKNNKAAINIGTIDSRTTIRSEDIKTLGAVYPNTKADNNVNGGGDNCLIELTKKYREQSKNNEKMETLLDEYNRANIEAIKEIGEIIPVNNAEKNNKAAINIGTIDSRTTIRSEDIKTLGAVYPNTKADNNVNGGGDNCLIELTKKYREQSKNNEKMETLLDEYNRANIEAIKEIGEIIPVNNAEKNNKAAINIGTIDSRTTIRSEDIKTLGAVYPNTKADNNVNGGGDNCLIELTKKYREQSKNNEKMETLLDEYNRANIEAIKEIGEIIPVNNAEKNNKAAINIGTIDSRTTIRSEDIKTLGAVYPNTNADDNGNGGGDNYLIELMKKYKGKTITLDEYNRANIEAMKEMGEIIPLNNAEKKENKAAINIGTIDSRTTIRSEDIKTLGATYPNTNADYNDNGDVYNYLIELMKTIQVPSQNVEKTVTLDEYNRANIEAIKKIDEFIPVNNAENKENKAAINIGTIDSGTTIRSEDIKTSGAIYPNTEREPLELQANTITSLAEFDENIRKNCNYTMTSVGADLLESDSDSDVSLLLDLDEARSQEAVDIIKIPACFLPSVKMTEAAVPVAIRRRKRTALNGDKSETSLSSLSSDDFDNVSDILLENSATDVVQPKCSERVADKKSKNAKSPSNESPLSDEQKRSYAKQLAEEVYLKRQGAINDYIMNTGSFGPATSTKEPEILPKPAFELGSKLFEMGRRVSGEVKDTIGGWNSMTAKEKNPEDA